MTCNVQGLADTVKRRQFFQYFREKNMQIVMVQETHARKSQHKIWKNQWGGEILFCDGESNAQGVAILISKKCNCMIKNFQAYSKGRVIIANLEIEGETYCLVNVYAPNEDMPEFFISLFQRVSEIDADHYIIGGDMNKTLNSDLDKRGGKIKITQSAEIINAFLEEAEWCDVWRETHQDRFQFTWRRQKIMTRLDYFFLPQGTFSKVSECCILPAYLSDHCPVVLELQQAHVIRGPGYWKFNTSHLNEKEFVDEINKIIDYAEFRYNDCNPINKWEMIKHDIREHAILYSCERAKERRIKKDRLEKKLQSQHKRLSMINLKSDNAIKHIQEINYAIDKIKLELQKISLYRAQGAILRSKVRWIEEGEKSSKYFFNLEKQRSFAKIMKRTISDSGQIITEQSQILNTQAEFYKKLYTKDQNVTSGLKFEPEQKLSNEEKNELDSNITIEEIANAIKEMARNKTPGTSGFQVNLYGMFWNKPKMPLYECFNYAYHTGTLSIGARQGIISLIPKKDRDLLYVKNWRPIILLNTDYKILAKIIANRIKLVLPKLIHSDQVGFMKQRNISVNIRKILDVIEYTEKENLPGIFVSLDFEKAFDRVDYDAMYSILYCYNFGDKIVNWIKLLFHNMQFSTINNGYMSDKITPTRGLFQGNPIASFLFLLGN